MVESEDAQELEVWEARPMLADPRRVEVGDVKWFPVSGNSAS